MAKYYENKLNRIEMKWNRTHAHMAYENVMCSTMKIASGLTRLRLWQWSSEKVRTHRDRGRERKRQKNIFDRIYDCAGWPQMCLPPQQQQQPIIEQTSTNEINVNKFWIKSQLMSLINDPTNCPFCAPHKCSLFRSSVPHSGTFRWAVPWNYIRFNFAPFLRFPFLQLCVIFNIIPLPHPQR